MKQTLLVIWSILLLSVFTACGASATSTPTSLPTPLPTVAPSPTLPPPATALQPTAVLTQLPITPSPTTAPQPTPFLSTGTPSPLAPSPTPTATSDVEAALREITDALSQLRGRGFIRPVQPNFISSGEIADYLASHIDAEDQAELALTQELYWALGLLDPSVELYPLYLALLKEQVVGLFDLDSEELLVVTGSFPLDPAGEVTLAHELVHALQQQHFDARKLVDDATSSLDQELALTALLEGDATLASALYVMARLTPDEALALESNVLPMPVFDNAPPAVQKSFIFPYDSGLQFTLALWQRSGSWQRVDQAYSQLPTATEQILHPAKYLVGEGPRSVSLSSLLPLLGDEWQMVSEDVLGEFMLRTYLESALDRGTAAGAAAGWGGDRFGLWRNTSGQRVLAYLAVWDSPGEAQEFFAAYQSFTDAAGNWTHRDAQAKLVRWEAAGKSVLLGLAEDQTLVILSPDLEIASRIISAFPQFQADKVSEPGY